MQVLVELADWPRTGSSAGQAESTGDGRSWAVVEQLAGLLVLEQVDDGEGARG